MALGKSFLFEPAYQTTYNYRTCGVQRVKNGVGIDVSFSGGASAFECDVSANGPIIECVRGSDYGGRIGGVLYILWKGGAAQDEPS